MHLIYFRFFTIFYYLHSFILIVLQCDKWIYKSPNIPGIFSIIEIVKSASIRNNWQNAFGWSLTCHGAFEFPKYISYEFASYTNLVLVLCELIKMCILICFISFITGFSPSLCWRLQSLQTRHWRWFNATVRMRLAALLHYYY